MWQDFKKNHTCASDPQFTTAQSKRIGTLKADDDGRLLLLLAL